MQRSILILLVLSAIHVAAQKDTSSNNLCLDYLKHEYLVWLTAGKALEEYSNADQRIAKDYMKKGDMPQALMWIHKSRQDTEESALCYSEARRRSTLIFCFIFKFIL